MEFEDSYFEIKNDPKVRGRGGYSNDEELKVYKAVLVLVILKIKM